MSKDPTGLDELLRIIDWDLKQQKIEGQFTHNERVSLLHKDISAYTTNKIIEELEKVLKNKKLLEEPWGDGSGRDVILSVPAYLIEDCIAELRKTL